mgnify:CR=1 FL=1
MKYTEEEILKKREERKREKYSTLETGIYMDGRIMQFQRQELFGEITVMLPDSMQVMPEEYARIRYPSHFRPALILTTSDLAVNLGFTLIRQDTEDMDTNAVAEGTRAAVRRAHPDFRTYPSVCLSENRGSWFAFRSHALDSDVYNLLLTMAAGKYLLQGSFNCPYQIYEKWKPVALMIWETIEEIKEEEAI